MFNIRIERNSSTFLGNYAFFAFFVRWEDWCFSRVCLLNIKLQPAVSKLSSAQTLEMELQQLWKSSQINSWYHFFKNLSKKLMCKNDKFAVCLFFKVGWMPDYFLALTSCTQVRSSHFDLLQILYTLYSMQYLLSLDPWGNRQRLPKGKFLFPAKKYLQSWAASENKKTWHGDVFFKFYLKRFLPWIYAL